MVEMTVESVRINLATNQRVVILKDAQGERYLFIWIANPEAVTRLPWSCKGGQPRRAR